MVEGRSQCVSSAGQAHGNYVECLLFSYYLYILVSHLCVHMEIDGMPRRVKTFNTILEVCLQDCLAESPEGKLQPERSGMPSLWAFIDTSCIDITTQIVCRWT